MKHLCLSGDCGDEVDVIIANKMCVAAPGQTSCDSAAHPQLISGQPTEPNHAKAQPSYLTK